MKLCNSPVALEQITKHPDVMRAMTGCKPADAARLQPYHCGLATLMKLRVTWAIAASWKRAHERRYGAGSAYDGGRAVEMPGAPTGEYSIRRVSEALEINGTGLPDGLRQLAAAWLEQQTA